jgi:hypothetical protein
MDAHIIFDNDMPFGVIMEDLVKANEKMAEVREKDYLKQAGSYEHTPAKYHDVHFWHIHTVPVIH